MIHFPWLSVSVFVLLLVAATVLSKTVLQTPSDLLKKEDELVQITCSHNIQGYDVIQWYKQNKNIMDLQLMGYLNIQYENIESEFKHTINLTGDGRTSCILNIKKLTSSDSAVYFCAAYGTDSGAGQAYFGNGTKLTVLESGQDVTEPEVKIIGPSKKQLCKKTVTLVCVAKKFYPDHVTIKWKIGNDDVIKGVATDPYATKDKKGMFDMSSRLKIKSNVYHNADKKFTCTVTFYNGTDYIDKSDTVKGIVGNGFDKGNHMRDAATVKLAYGVFIAKSGLYGIFIFFFVRRQVSAGK